MKFKENAIKPGMVIHCPKEEDARALLEHLENIGYYITNLVKNRAYSTYKTQTCFYINCPSLTLYAGKPYVSYGDVETYAHPEEDSDFVNCVFTEFSDLIEPDDYDIDITGGKIRYGGNLSQLNNLIDDSPINPDIDSPMTAEELMRWFMEHYGDGTFKDVFDLDYSFEELISKYEDNAGEIIEKITAYEAAKKAPKPVEVEWVDVCRIIQIQDNGFKKCVYEEEIPKDTADCLGIAEEILKRYISDHDGEHIAVIEDICRVKEGK